MNLSGSHLDYLAAFFGGVLVSFSPCVYPLIPVSVGFIGASSEGSRLRAVALSFIYVTGVAVVYSLLGLFAVLAGKIFGLITEQPAAYFISGGLIVVFGLSMLDLFVIGLPGINPPVFKKLTYFGSFVLGLGSGLMVSPCLTPVLGSILAYLATKKNLFYGATLLFVFAYGMGLVLILAGVFSASILSVLPKSGKWLNHVKAVLISLL